MPRRLTHGSGFVHYFSVPRDGKVIAYFAAGPRGPELRLRDFERGTDSTVDTWGAASPGFPAISLDGTRIAFGTLVPDHQCAGRCGCSISRAESLGWLMKMREGVRAPGSTTSEF
jgi:hypothetical protein